MQNSDSKWIQEISAEKTFLAEIQDLGRELHASSGKEDLQQFQKMHLWSLCASLAGYALAWTFVNPLSVVLIGLGNFTRWSIVFHGASHGMFDSWNQNRYRSRRYARGWRRFLDWPDWILPEYWDKEHNHLHHHFTGSDSDPDIVWRNTRYIRQIKAPVFIKSVLAVVVSLI